MDIKFSFGNCLDDDNNVKPPPRIWPTFPKLCSTTPSTSNAWRNRGFPPSPVAENAQRDLGSSQRHHSPDLLPVPCQRQAGQAEESSLWAGQGFGYGTVHHAAGTLRMPWRKAFDQSFHNGRSWMKTSESTARRTSMSATCQ